MRKYKRVREVVDVATFEEVVEYAKENSDAPHWSFQLAGCPITHENDECFLLGPQGDGKILKFTPNDVLVIVKVGVIYPYPKEIFVRLYELV